jgi:hypothetical protein
VGGEEWRGAGASIVERMQRRLEWWRWGLAADGVVGGLGDLIRISCQVVGAAVEVVDLGVWRVTRDGMKPPKNPEKPTTSEEKEIHLNARAKNCLYESLSMDIFNQVFTLKTANEIWLKLHELHDDTSICL